MEGCVCVCVAHHVLQLLDLPAAGVTQLNLLSETGGQAGYGLSIAINFLLQTLQLKKQDSRGGDNWVFSKYYY